MKNIAIIIPKMYGGGAEKVASKLSTYLSNEKYEKYIFVYDSNNANYTFNGKIVDLKTPETKSFVKKIFNFIIRLYKIKRLKKRKQIDTTISLLSNPNLINLITKKNDKIIISVRNYLSKSSTGFYGKTHQWLIRKFYNKADKVIVVSEMLKEDLVNSYNIQREKIKVINNFYDIDKIKFLSSKPIEEDKNEIFKNPSVVTAGRLSKQKGHWHLIRAFKAVKEKIPNAKLIILGQGELKKYLMYLVKEMKLEQDVYFLGFKNNPYKYIAKADIYAFPSLYEGFPNALCEAMACGLPIISSNCKSGPREILNPSSSLNTDDIEYVDYSEYGILFPTCNGKMYGPEETLSQEERLLAQSIVKLFENQKLKRNYQLLSQERINDFHLKEIIPEWEYQISE